MIMQRLNLLECSKPINRPPRWACWFVEYLLFAQRYAQGRAADARTGNGAQWACSLQQKFGSFICKMEDRLAQPGSANLNKIGSAMQRLCILDTRKRRANLHPRR